MKIAKNIVIACIYNHAKFQADPFWNCKMNPSYHTESLPLVWSYILYMSSYILKFSYISGKKILY